MAAATMYIAIIFLPGILWASIHAKFGTSRRVGQAEFVVSSFLFGVAAHIATFCIYEYVFDATYNLASLSDIDKILEFSSSAPELLTSSGVSLLMALLWMYANRHKVAARALQALRATNRFGDEDVWSSMHNSGEPNFDYVHIRDPERQRVFVGWVHEFSEDDSIRELILRDAIVYDEGGQRLSSAPYLYLARPKDSLWIEFPYGSGAEPVAESRSRGTGSDTGSGA